MSEPVLFVAGIGRCGTTLVMTMLDAGGFPITGPRPSYEPAERWSIGAPDVEWVSGCGGRAVKWIDPSQCLWLPTKMPVKPVVILMERHPREQARSQCKMLFVKSRQAEKAMERSIRRDIPKARARLRATAHLYKFRFEEALANPFWFARALDRITVEHWGRNIDTDSAMRAVIPRHPCCAPDLRLETHILPLLAARIEGAAG